jgi:hypothetical protein
MRCNLDQNSNVISPSAVHVLWKSDGSTSGISPLLGFVGLKSRTAWRTEKTPPGSRVMGWEDFGNACHRELVTDGGRFGHFGGLFRQAVYPVKSGASGNEAMAWENDLDVTSTRVDS